MAANTPAAPPAKKAKIAADNTGPGASDGYDYSKSTRDNYTQEKREFFGEFAGECMEVSAWLHHPILW